MRRARNFASAHLRAKVIRLAEQGIHSKQQQCLTCALLPAREYNAECSSDSNAMRRQARIRAQTASFRNAHERWPRIFGGTNRGIICGNKHLMEVANKRKSLWKKMCARILRLTVGESWLQER